MLENFKKYSNRKLSGSYFKEIMVQFNNRYYMDFDLLYILSQNV